VWNIPKGVPKTRPAYVRLLGDYLKVWLHWTTQGKIRSLPCHTENCPHCPDRSFLHGYAPALLWVEDRGNTQQGWVPIVCGLSCSLMDALEGIPAAGVLLAMWREGDSRKNWTGFEILETEVKDQPPPAFDVTPILKRVWGYQEKVQALEQQQQQQAGQAKPPELAPPSSPIPPLAPPPAARPVELPPPVKPAVAGEARKPLPKMADLVASREPAILPFEPPAKVEPATAEQLQDLDQGEAKKPKKPRRKKGGA
jgi:hypothetical protein